MRSGALREIIVLERQLQVGISDLNEPNMVWLPWIEDLPAEMTSRRGKEQFDPQTKQRMAEVVYHFRCRYMEIEGADETMRIRHEGQIYKIRTILPDQYNKSDVIIETTLTDGNLALVPMRLDVKTKIPVARIGVAYPGFKLTASGAQGAPAFEMSSALAWLVLDAQTGLVSGTPTGPAGTVIVSFTATDGFGGSATLPVPIIVQ